MEILERIPWAAKNSIFAKLGEIAEVANLSKLQRRKYDQDLKIFRDSVNILKYAKEEGREEVRAVERAVAHQDNLESAYSLYKMNTLTIEQIASAMHLVFSLKQIISKFISINTFFCFFSCFLFGIKKNRCIFAYPKFHNKMSKLKNTNKCVLRCGKRKRPSVRENAGHLKHTFFIIPKFHDYGYKN